MINRFALYRFNEKKRVKGFERPISHSTLMKDEVTGKMERVIDLWLVDGKWTVRADYSSNF